MATVVEGMIAVYGMILSFMAGWLMPRGNFIRKFKLWFTKRIYNWLAHEKEKIKEKSK